VSVHENETDKGAHIELAFKNGYCKSHTWQYQKFIELFYFIALISWCLIISRRSLMSGIKIDDPFLHLEPPRFK
jgi:hypothetical protein